MLDTIGVIAKELWHPKENEYWIQPRIFSIPTPVDDVNYRNFSELHNYEILSFRFYQTNSIVLK